MTNNNLGFSISIDDNGQKTVNFDPSFPKDLEWVVRACANKQRLGLKNEICLFELKQHPNSEDFARWVMNEHPEVMIKMPDGRVTWGAMTESQSQVRLWAFIRGVVEVARLYLTVRHGWMIEYRKSSDTITVGEKTFKIVTKPIRGGAEYAESGWLRFDEV